MANSVNITGLNQVVANLQAIENQVNAKVKQAVSEVCLDLQGKAQLLAPVDSGDLRGSASTQITESGNTITGKIGFGVEYALIQHETLWFRHPRGGQAKYLENPMKENETRYVAHIESSVRTV